VTDSLDRLRVALADRYAVERELGRGGMAAVYLATDLRHERAVAIKVLQAELGSALGPERFLREIKTTARLTHPHILPLLDSGEADGLLFYVMPYVEGESLRERLQKQKQLPLEVALRIAREVAEALSYAHEQGVIHRDIKPANILLEADHAAVADFGIAQAIDVAGGERLTETGIAVGTPAYMSPEQAGGGEELDGRSDLYSLGCVLYEMLAGVPPFAGATAQSLLRQHLVADPPSVTAIRPTVPEWVADAISRALAKAPADRFETTTEFAAALTFGGSHGARRWTWLRQRPRAALGAVIVVALAVVGLANLLRTTEPSSPSRQRIAVLPLENETGAPSFESIGEWASDYITDVINGADLPGVETVDPQSMIDAATSSPDEGTTPDLALEWPRVLGATLALKGSLRLHHDSLRFDVRLIDPEGTILETATPVTGHADRPEEVLGALGLSATEALARHVSPGDVWALSTDEGREIPRVDAHKATREGWLEIVRDNNEAAIPFFHQAHELDPDYFQPLYLLALAFENLRRWAEADSVCRIIESTFPHVEGLRRLKAEKACAIARGDPWAFFRAQQQITERAPNGAAVLGEAYLMLNRPREAVEAFRKYDPHLGNAAWGWAQVNWWAWATALHMLRDYADELRLVQTARTSFPEYDGLNRAMLRALVALGRTSEAQDSLATRLALLEPERRPGLLIRIGDELDAHGAAVAAAASWIRALEELAPAPLEDTMSADNIRQRSAVLIRLGRLDDAEALALSLTNDPPNVETTGLLGLLRAMQGDSAEARRFSQRLAAVDAPYINGMHTEWRARIAAHIDSPEEAVRLLSQAIEEGIGFYYSYDRLHRDPFLRPLRGQPAFEAVLNPGR